MATDEQLQRVRGTWTRVTQAGVSPHMPTSLRKRLVVTNLFALTVSAIAVFWFGVYKVFWVPVLERMMYVLVATGLAIPWINARGHVVASRLIILGVSCTAGAAYALVMGPKAGIVIMFLPLVCAPLALFDLRERALMALALPFPIVLAVFVQWYQSKYPPLASVPPATIEHAATISLITATFLVGAMMSFLYSVHASAEARIEQGYHDLLRTSDEVVLFVERDGRITDCNAEVERQLGYPRTALLGMHIRELDDAMSLTAWTELLARVTADGPTVQQCSYRRQDRNTYPAEVRVGLVTEGVGRAIVGVRDVSRRAELEARLRMADRLVSVGTLAAGVAHEVNNPLGYITLNLERIQRRIQDSVDGLRDDQRREVLEALQMALEGSDKVRTIVNDLKTFSRGSQPESTAVDIERVLGSTLKLASLELRSKAEIVTKFEGVPAVWGNEARLAQVALNLFLNAAQAMDRGRDTNVLHVATRAEAGGTVRVTISDTGRGIPEPERDRIFDPFFTTRDGGTGLGLYVCRSIVAESGGEIRVESRPGAGTTFVLTLPVAHGVRKESEPQAAREPETLTTV